MVPRLSWMLLKHLFCHPRYPVFILGDTIIITHHPYLHYNYEQESTLQLRIINFILCSVDVRRSFDRKIIIYFTNFESSPSVGCQSRYVSYSRLTFCCTLLKLDIDFILLCFKSTDLKQTSPFSRKEHLLCLSPLFNPILVTLGKEGD